MDEGEDDLDAVRGGVCLGFMVGLGCTRVGVTGAEGGVGGAKTDFFSSFGVVGLSSFFAAKAGFASGFAAVVPNTLVPAWENAPNALVAGVAVLLAPAPKADVA